MLRLIIGRSGCLHCIRFRIARKGSNRTVKQLFRQRAALRHRPERISLPTPIETRISARVFNTTRVAAEPWRRRHSGLTVSLLPIFSAPLNRADSVQGIGIYIFQWDVVRRQKSFFESLPPAYGTRALRTASASEAILVVPRERG